MLARSATCWSVSPCSARHSRSRRRTRASTGSSLAFAGMAKDLGTRIVPRQADRHGHHLGLHRRRRRPAAGLSGRARAGCAAARSWSTPGSRATASRTASAACSATHPPAGRVLRRRARQLGAYPTVELRSGEVVRAERDGDGFVLELADVPRSHASRAARHRHGLPLPGAAGGRGALGPIGVPLPVLPRLGGPRRATRRARPWRRGPAPRAAAAHVERRRDALRRRGRRAGRRRAAPAGRGRRGRSTSARSPDCAGRATR